MTRIYLPTTPAGLEALVGQGFQPPLTAYAVTAALREWYAEGEADELEYAAADDAARACLDLLAAAPGQPACRVVVAADVPDGDVQAEAGAGRPRSAVRVSTAVTRDAVVSLHLDDDTAAGDVAAAVGALAAADAGDADAQLRVEDAAGHELLWYDVTELDDLLRRHPAGPGDAAVLG